MKNRIITVQGANVTISTRNEQDCISLTDMLKAKDGDFFISDWLRNRNTVEFLGIWESIYNPDFNNGEFAIIKIQAGLNSYKLSASSVFHDLPPMMVCVGCPAKPIKPRASASI